MSSLNIKTQTLLSGHMSRVKNMAEVSIFVDENFRDPITFKVFKGEGKKCKKREKCLIEVMNNGITWEGDIDDLHETLFDKTDWNETFFEISHEIAQHAGNANTPKKIQEIEDTEGRGGLYELAKRLTDEFQHIFRNDIKDGEYFDTLEKFLKEKLYK